ncbi:MAG: hypothetical protein NVSMB9_16510 [Isosphaeraceae bacterium]
MPEQYQGPEAQGSAEQEKNPVSDETQAPVKPLSGHDNPPSPRPEPGAFPAGIPISSTSGDELSLSLSQARPDPFLEAFGTKPTEPASPNAPDEAPLSDQHTHEPARDIGGPFDSTEALGAALPTINLDAPVARPNQAPQSLENDEDDGQDDDPASHRSSLGTLILASYASAVTLGLIWVLWSGRRLREPAEPEFFPPSDQRPDPGYRADHARRLVPPQVIAADHLTRLGKSVRLGQIEATPLSIRSGGVRLVRNFGGSESKAGGENALFLRIRLRNLSTDLVLAPLDEAFLRERLRADPDSFIETTREGKTIAMYPLAIESEWAIQGQEFRDLKPGDSTETWIVSAPEALMQVSTEMTWRIRLRTDINHTDDLGVLFRADEIKGKP